MFINTILLNCRANERNYRIEEGLAEVSLRTKPIPNKSRPNRDKPRVGLTVPEAGTPLSVEGIVVRPLGVADGEEVGLAEGVAVKAGSP